MGQQKYFIITIDTEGDNLWEWDRISPIRTENTLYLERFQKLSNEYGFIPTWLTNWEMLNDDRYIDFANKYIGEGKCELGMHLHAWNTPPYYDLPSHEKSGKPYLIEYPVEVMEQKIISMNQLFMDKLGFTPKTHRAGRWAIDDTYLRLLREQGYVADCSITPGYSWEKSVGQTPGFDGPNYKQEKYEVTNRDGILEIPLTLYFTHKMIFSTKKNWIQNKKEFKHLKDGRCLWLRPNGRNRKEMLCLINIMSKMDADYIMMMIHSSELMPGGSPSFKTETDIENLYSDIETVFKRISREYLGIGLEEYAKRILNGVL